MACTTVTKIANFKSNSVSQKSLSKSAGLARALLDPYFTLILLGRLNLCPPGKQRHIHLFLSVTDLWGGASLPWHTWKMLRRNISHS